VCQYPNNIFLTIIQQTLQGPGLQGHTPLHA
jgi:hypothetical protein